MYKQEDTSTPLASNAERFFTPHQRLAQSRFADPARAAQIINRMPDTDALSAEQIGFLETLPFFFLATSDGAQNIQCNFKGGGPGLLRAGDSRTLYYPEFPGNDLMLSVGNMLAHPPVALLALSFAGQRRLKVNGTAAILEISDCPFQWSGARLCVRIDIREVIHNCARRIPHLREA